MEIATGIDFENVAVGLLSSAIHPIPFPTTRVSFKKQNQSLLLRLGVAGTWAADIMLLAISQMAEPLENGVPRLAGLQVP